MADSYSGHAPFQGEAGAVHRSRRGRRGPTSSTSAAWSLDARDPAGRLRARRLRFRAAQRRAAHAESRCARQYSPSNYEVYDYPGRVPAEGGWRSDWRRSASTSSRRSSRPRRRSTNAKNISVGSLFTLEKCAARRSEPRAPGRRRRPTISNSATTKRCRTAAGRTTSAASSPCRASSSSAPKRLTPKPFVQGPQTAVVVGPGGEEIYTDKYGRVKVLFHWDREGEKKKDENSSCWIRVSQPWAGKAWGGVTIPRIGQEVIVDFLEGDPDQPIITGRVYNAEQMPPYALPANKTQSGIKSRSSQGRHAGQLQRDPVRGQEGLGAALHPRREEPGHRGRERRDPLGRARSDEDDRQRRDDHVKHDRTETSTTTRRSRSGGNRTESVSARTKRSPSARIAPRASARTRVSTSGRISRSASAAIKLARGRQGRVASVFRREPHRSRSRKNEEVTDREESAGRRSARTTRYRWRRSL